ncbi:hypothetical protein BV25DRAFT_1843785 [Artomyces pyxidatus]|uniref:Uncharacterized protein n=1 Tax=Artomyces pyxidatus TaxID=48021 RepID=A0ACB8SDG9_9AGAM|nr:hypothetical protein BV25DRAFT_1843785 [Artomyces pyxidatus]
MGLPVAPPTISPPPPAASLLPSMSAEIPFTPLTLEDCLDWDLFIHYEEGLVAYEELNFCTPAQFEHLISHLVHNSFDATMEVLDKNEDLIKEVFGELGLTVIEYFVINMMLSMVYPQFQDDPEKKMVLVHHCFILAFKYVVRELLQYPQWKSDVICLVPPTITWRV